MALTEKQKLFADEYLIDFNATRAYKEIYKTCKKDAAANVNGSKLLSNAKVAEYIDKRMQDRSKRTEITQDWVLQELYKVASTNGADFAKVILNDGEPEIELVETDKLTEDKKAAIASIKHTKFGVAVESYDRVKALELLGKHLGMFKDRAEISGDLGINITVDYGDKNETG